jgi:HAD superfamily hydrolase (TIGR01549 family)
MAHKILAVCLDCGDTLIDESTEVKTKGDISLGASLIPGADELLHELKHRQYPLALVADGPVVTFENNLGPYRLYELFDAYAISETVGVSKPNPRIFHTALRQLGITAEEYSQVVMVGNNLGCDVKGANNLGIVSVWLDWAPRRAKLPADTSEQPQFTIKKPLDLLGVIEELEEKL